MIQQDELKKVLNIMPWLKGAFKEWSDILADSTKHVKKEGCGCCDEHQKTASDPAKAELSTAEKIISQFQEKGRTAKDPLPTVNFIVPVSERKAVPNLSQTDVFLTLLDIINKAESDSDPDYDSKTVANLIEGSDFYIIPAYINKDGQPEAIIPAGGFATNNAKWAAVLNRLALNKAREALKDAYSK